MSLNDVLQLDRLAMTNRHDNLLFGWIKCSSLSEQDFHNYFLHCHQENSSAALMVNLFRYMLTYNTLFQ